ncbi:MAG: tetratricopeptide repeat protein [Verrucomicrobiia bacterium]
MASDDAIPWFRRVVPGGLLVGVGLWVLSRIGEGGGANEGGGEVAVVVVQALLGLGLMLGGATLVARPLAQVIVTPFVRLLFPEDHDYTPPPLYPLARYYWRQGRVEEAERQYRKILRHHRQEGAAYRELVELLMTVDRRREAETVFRRGMAVLKDATERERLREVYEGLVAGAAWVAGEEPK